MIISISMFVVEIHVFHLYAPSTPPPPASETCIEGAEDGAIQVSSGLEDVEATPSA
jgi:hypothetical protein